MEGYITTIDNKFKKVICTKLNAEYFANKSDVASLGWTITDAASGLSIATKLPTLKACKEYLASLTDEQKAEINKLKSTQKYLDICAKIAELKK